MDGKRTTERQALATVTSSFTSHTSSSPLQPFDISPSSATTANNGSLIASANEMCITTHPRQVANASSASTTTKSNNIVVSKHRSADNQSSFADTSIVVERASTQQQQRLLPTLDGHSDTTICSSERSSCSSSSSGDGAFGSDDDDDDIDDDHEDPTGFLVKPMSSMLQVCPVDDLAVEEEKRRRRSRQNSNRKHTKRTCADAESLPTTPRSLQLIMPPRNVRSLDGGIGATATVAPIVAPQLGRDSMAIRRQYWTQLGISLTRRDLERSTGRKKERKEGLKVRLNDAGKQGESKTFFQFIASWYGADKEQKDATTSKSSNSTSETEGSARRRGSSLSRSDSILQRKKTVVFNEEAELFYIPLHRDYSKRQRDCMWHTRSEFIAMVERNLDDVYEEMEREYEEQCQAEAMENEVMEREEALMRAYLAELQVKEADKAKAAAVSSPTLRIGSNGSNPIPSLTLCPTQTQIKLAPRARSPHDIRFKYLKHLGIKNS